MIARKVTSTQKDSSGNITALCNPGEWWSPRNAIEIINDIELWLYEYYVMIGSQKVFVKVVEGENRKYLRTDPDRTTKNNLDELPDC